MKFIPCKSLPQKGDPYYNTKSVGGYSPSIVGSPVVDGLNVLCNCVGWVLGRFNSESNEGYIKYMGTMNAKSFFKVAYKWGLKTGSTPKLGAIICFDGVTKSDLGHVGIVEQIDPDGAIWISDSGYNKYDFKFHRLTNSDGNWNYPASKYKFQGFIYNPAFESDPIEEINELLNSAIKYVNDAQKLLQEL